MPRITPARSKTPALSSRVAQKSAQKPSTSETGGWCSDCYAAGQYTLAADGHQLCLRHAQDSGAGPRRSARPASRRHGGRPDPHGPGRRGGSPAGPRLLRRGPDAPETIHSAARRRAGALEYGRRRAVNRVRAGRFEVHPGWRGRVPASFDVVTDQVFALERISVLVDAETWCPRQRREWTAMLTAMVQAMDWETGLIAGITRERLADVVGRSTRSVSRMWCWAQDVGLLARVEEGASAQWLGTDRNRAATFVIVAAVGSIPDRQPESDPAGHVVDSSSPLSSAVDKSGNPPASCVSKKPLKRLNQTSTHSWPSFRIPELPSQRLAAARLLVTRTGLDVRGLDQQRLCGLLKPWWQAGACVAGLLWAIDHHPDYPERSRGDAIRGAHDPLAVLGHRLRPWAGRIGELPANLRGLSGDYLAAQEARLAKATATVPDLESPSPASSNIRAAAQAAVRTHLAQLARRRDHASATEGR